jgi:hypothetical protein
MLVLSNNKAKETGRNSLPLSPRTSNPQLGTPRSRIDLLLLELIYTRTDWDKITARMKTATLANRTVKCYKSRWYRCRYSLLEQDTPLVQNQRAQGRNLPKTLLSVSEQNRILLAKENALLLELIYIETDWTQLAMKMNGATGTNQTSTYYQSLCNKKGESPFDQLISPSRDIPDSRHDIAQNLSLRCKFSATGSFDAEQRGHIAFQLAKPNTGEGAARQSPIIKEEAGFTAPGMNTKMSSVLGWISAKTRLAWRRRV